MYVFWCFPLIGIQSGQQDSSGRAGSYAEHVRGTDYGPARTQRCWKDNNTLHADR